MCKNKKKTPLSWAGSRAFSWEDLLPGRACKIGWEKSRTYSQFFRALGFSANQSQESAEVIAEKFTNFSWIICGTKGHMTYLRSLRGTKCMIFSSFLK